LTAEAKRGIDYEQTSLWKESNTLGNGQLAKISSVTKLLRKQKKNLAGMLRAKKTKRMRVKAVAMGKKGKVKIHI